MTWTKRDPVSNLVVLGDDDGQTRKVAGLLASLKQDSMYPSRHNYELVRQDGSSIWLAGSASIGRQIGPADVGKFIKCTFTGWGKSKNGRFKEIEVQVWDGEPQDGMKKWPRWNEIQKRAEAERGVTHVLPADDGASVDDDGGDDFYDGGAEDLPW